MVSTARTTNGRITDSLLKEARREPRPQEHAEGRVAEVIENQTAKLPSDLFLWSALASMAVSATAYVRGDKELSMFVGQWAPSLLILGLYNKLVKQQGHDRSRGRR
jgi:hypothetical protein